MHHRRSRLATLQEMCCRIVGIQQRRPPVLLSDENEKRLHMMRKAEVSREDLLCGCCSGAMIVHGWRECVADDGRIYDDQKTFLTECISTHDEDLSYHYCHRCRYWYLECPLCSDAGTVRLCQFMEHGGWERGCDSRRRRRSKQPSGDFLSEEERGSNEDERGSDDEEDGEGGYDVEDMCLLHCDAARWNPTGPDGGSSHRWRCWRCLTAFTDSDK